jgi:hypothetical protein
MTIDAKQIIAEAQAATAAGDIVDLGSPSWRPVDLGSVLDGSYKPPRPSVGRRDDDVGLFYPGRRHDAYGESESGKTWFALLAVVRELQAGHAAAYFDFEDEAAAFVERLRALGVDDAAIRDRFAYVRPDEPLTAPGNADVLAEVLGDLKPTLGVVDGVTEAMVLHGLDLRDNVDVATFGRLLPGRITHSGAAALTLDHVAKDRGSRRYAIGGQHKLAGLNGAAYLIENRAAFGIGVTGRSTVYLTKDRPAALRRHALPSAGGIHWFADLVIGPVDREWSDQLDAHLNAPAARDEPWRPTVLMSKVSDALERAGTALTVRGVLDRVHGKRDADVRAALAALVDEGFVTVEDGPRGARLHRLVKPFGDDQ